MIQDVRGVFDKYDDEFLEFSAIRNPKSSRADLHAFMLLDQLVPGKSNMIASAEHDEVWLDVELDDLAEVATEDQIVELIRCGVRLDDDGLCMFA